tara:strand:- start:633 stop:1037 length:405 start_codon:yes stop_codon:yes gene_type:complete
MSTHSVAPKIRLDKWLWAARFFKTRGLAKQAIEGGKVHYNGVRSKVSKIVEVGAELQIRQGLDEKVIEVLLLSEQRRGAPEAMLLYRETDESLLRREAAAAQRKIARAGQPAESGRPTKKGRRQIHSFKQQQGD